ncbi:hypothetical protein J6590_073048 [Homalodisca vitripennis]|nr:hypothetical protein J6590_073048 [Homalodisca vitripennis]
MAGFRAFQPHSLFDLAKRMWSNSFFNNGSALMSLEVPLTVRDALIEEHMKTDCFQVMCTLYVPLGSQNFYCGIPCLRRDMDIEPESAIGPLPVLVGGAFVYASAVQCAISTS